MNINKWLLTAWSSLAAAETLLIAAFAMLVTSNPAELISAGLIVVLLIVFRASVRAANLTNNQIHYVPVFWALVGVVGLSIARGEMANSTLKGMVVAVSIVVTILFVKYYHRMIQLIRKEAKGLMAIAQLSTTSLALNEALFIGLEEGWLEGDLWVSMLAVVTALFMVTFAYVLLWIYRIWKSQQVAMNTG
jgi:hypothetical protein